MHGSSLDWVPHPLFGLDAMLVATLVVLVTYGIIISERMNRAIVALLGAAAMIFLGVLNQEAAIRGIDFNTIALLIGMMIIVAITRRCGIFQAIAIWTAKTETPPVPSVSTVDPGPSTPSSKSACQAVSAAHGSVAACS